MDIKITKLNIAAFIAILLSVIVIFIFPIYLFDDIDHLIKGLSLLYVIWSILFSVIIWNCLCRVLKLRKTRYIQWLGLLFIYFVLLCLLPNSFGYYYRPTGGYMMFRSISEVIKAPTIKVTLIEQLGTKPNSIRYWLFFGRYTYSDGAIVKDFDDLKNTPNSLEYALLKRDYTAFIQRYQVAEYTEGLIGSAIPTVLFISVEDMDSDYQKQNPYWGQVIAPNVYRYYLKKSD